MFSVLCGGSHQLLVTQCLSVTPWTAARQARLSFTISRSLLKSMATESVIPSNHLILCCPLLLLPSFFPSIRVFSSGSLFISGGQNIGASVLVLPVTIQDWFPLGWTGWSPGSPRDCQESSPTAQFKSINTSVLSFLYSPTLISVHDYWKKR